MGTIDQVNTGKKKKPWYAGSVYTILSYCCLVDTMDSFTQDEIFTAGVEDININ